MHGGEEEGRDRVKRIIIIGLNINSGHNNLIYIVKKPVLVNTCVVMIGREPHTKQSNLSLLDK